MVDTFYYSANMLESMYEDYSNNLLPPTPKEGLVINPKVAYCLTKQDIIRHIPLEWVKKNSSVYGDLSKLSLTDPVANLKWDYLYFVDTDVFRPAATAFKNSVKNAAKSGIKASYTPFVKGTKSYEKFWEEEFRRIVYGYEPIIDGRPCGVRIPGEFYFYLNYVLINKIVVSDSGQTSSVEDFPDFLAMDYYYYKELEARENPTYIGLSDDYKKSMIVAKSRRKGFSYKAAAGAVWIAAFNYKARVAIASEPNTQDATDAVKCALKCIPIIDHLSNYTPFGRQDIGDPKTNGGWKNEITKITKDQVYINLGVFNTKTREKEGRQSVIFTMSLGKDDAASGEGLNRLYIEEAGKVGNLDKAWIFARESMKAGSLMRGIAIIFGTGGEMVSSAGRDGSTRPFSNLFHSPIAAELADFDNIYEYKDQPKESRCGYFISDMWSNFGAYINVNGKKYPAIDKQGNALFWVAELCLNKERLEKQPPASKQRDYNKFLTQRCKTPSEAFLITSGSIFNTVDLIARRNEIVSSRNGFDKFRRKGDLVEKSDGTIEFKIDLTGELEPILSMNYDNSSREGCLLLYEFPQTIHGVIPDDGYLITVDAIGKNNEGGESLIAIIVMKTPKYYSYMGPEKIVATYFGRKKVRPLDYMHRLLHKLSKFYNAKITYENDQDGGILQYFLSRNALDRLMPSPMMVTKKHLPNSKTLLREFGHSMGSPKHKSFGEMYLNEWLDYRHPSRQFVNDKGEVIDYEGKRNLDLLEDEFLIEQLINYNRAGNFDAVDALMGGIVQFQERYSDSSFEMFDDDYLVDMKGQVLDYYASLVNTDQAKNEYNEYMRKIKRNTKQTVSVDNNFTHNDIYHDDISNNFSIADLL